MKLKICLLSAFLCTAFLPSQAQQFFEGYIIQHGSKTNGLIHFSPKKEDKSEYITFKTTKDAEPQQIKADQIEEFYLDKYNTRFLPVKDEQSGITLFTEVLKDGTATLSNRDKLYVITKDTADLQLYLPISKVMYKDGSQIYDVKIREIKVMGTVKNFLSDCPELVVQSISPSALQRMVDKYNFCMDHDLLSTKKKGGFHMGIVAGPSVSMMNFDAGRNSPYYYLSQVKFDPGIGYVFGLNFAGNSKRFLGLTTMNVQVLYSYSTFKGSGGFEIESALYSEEDEVEISVSRLRIPITVRRYFTPGNNGLFFDLGISLNKLLKLESYRKFEAFINETIPYSSGEQNDFLRKQNLSLSVPGDIGFSKTINKIKWTGLIRADYDFGFVDQPGLSQQLFNVNFLLILEF